MYNKWPGNRACISVFIAAILLPLYLKYSYTILQNPTQYFVFASFYIFQVEEDPSTRWAVRTNRFLPLLVGIRPSSGESVVGQIHCKPTKGDYYVYLALKREKKTHWNLCFMIIPVHRAELSIQCIKVIIFVLIIK